MTICMHYCTYNRIQIVHVGLLTTQILTVATINSKVDTNKAKRKQTMLFS